MGLGPLAALRRCAVFDDLRPEDLAGIDDGLRLRDEPEGTWLLRQGDASNGLLVIVTGQAAVERASGALQQRLAVLGPGDLAGEIAPVAGGTRDASVVALSPTTVVEVAASALDALLARRSDLAERLAELARARLRHSRLREHLTQLFPGLDTATLDDLATRAGWVHLRAGETLFRAGDPADDAFVVVHGRLHVHAPAPDGDSDDDPQPIAEVVRGELVGEVALLVDRGVRSATLSAVRDCELARIPRDGLQRLLVERPEATLAVSRIVVERLRPGAGQRRADRSTSIVVVPTGPGVDVRRICDQLEPRLARYGDVHRLSRETVGAALGRPDMADVGVDDPAAIRLRQWLYELETSRAFLLFEATPAWSAWNERALRHADQVVLVADAGADPAPSSLEEQLEATLGQRTPTRTLVLQHDPTVAQPRGTADWLELRRVHEHLHVRRDDARDLDRLGRWLAGRAVGLVLSGGGARAFAHLGVIRAMHELGIPIDALAGTSNGAVMALAPARGFLGAEAADDLRPHFGAFLRDYTVPFVALLRGREVVRHLSFLDGLDLADLWLPLTIVSTDLTAATSRVHRRGAALTAAVASTAVPGIFPPVVDEGHLLVDGGLTDNLPVGVLRRQLPTGTIVAADVSARLEPALDEGVTTDVSGWRLLGERLLPRRARTRVPPISSTILRSMMVSSHREKAAILEAGIADLHLDLPVAGYGLMEMEHLDAIAEVGYAMARAPLERWAAASAGRW
jgi:predicted acylesterase/phospholipase RssA/CRP-like cAMP-binding protein